MVNAFRYGMLGVSDISVGFALAMISFFIILFYILSLYILKRGIGIRS
jgi:ABC-2 type transport system permease protein